MGIRTEAVRVWRGIGRRVLRRLEPYLVEEPDPPWTESAPPPGQEAPAASLPRIEVAVWGEGTPNPHAMKFTTNVRVVASGTRTYASAAEANGDPVGRALFELPGVKRIFAVNDFVTVTKDDEAEWSALQPRIEAALREALQRNA